MDYDEYEYQMAREDECEVCGSDEIYESRGVQYCENCGATYSGEDAKIYAFLDGNF